MIFFFFCFLKNSIEYSEICKAIRRKMKEDIRKHDEKQIIEGIENSKSLKQARQKQHLGKGQLISIMQEDGMHLHEKDRIVKRCVEFYEELYRSRRASADQDSRDDRTTTSSIDPPSILLRKYLEWNDTFSKYGVAHSWTLYVISVVCKMQTPHGQTNFKISR